MEKVVESLLAQGPLVAMALVAVIVLYRDNRRLTKENKDLSTKLLDQAEGHEDEMLAEREKRVDEQKAATAALRESNQALKGAADALLSTRRSRSQPPTSGNG